MYGSLDISTSGMIAQRTRMQVIAANLANKDTLVNSRGEYEPYLRRAAMLEPAGHPDNPQGVRIAAIDIQEGALREQLMPGHKFADENDIVMVPDIDSTTEWVNGLQASRAYEANVAAAETMKNMVAQALRLLA